LNGSDIGKKSQILTSPIFMV